MGTTLGMLLADVPAVFLGDKFAQKIPMKLVHGIAATIFALLGVLTLLRADRVQPAPRLVLDALCIALQSLVTTNGGRNNVRKRYR